MTNQQTTKGEWHDWVGELFEPVFGATIDDLVAHEEEPDNKPKVKHISVYDPDAVRRVYEKVQVMTKLDEEMRRQQSRQAKKQATEARQIPKEQGICTIYYVFKADAY